MKKNEEELKDEAHLRSTFEVAIRQALRVDVLFVKESFVDAVIERAKGEGGFNEEYLKGAFLGLVTVPPRPIPEEVVNVHSRPQGKDWKVEIKSSIAHWILSEFIRKHQRVEITRSQGNVVCKCLNCFRRVDIPSDKIPHSPTYYQVNLEDCDERD